MHFLKDVAATNELTLNVHLGEGGPVRVLLDAFTEVLVKQDVDVLVVLHSVKLEDLHGIVAEAAAGHLL